MPSKDKEQLEGMDSTEKTTVIQEVPVTGQEEASKKKGSRRKLKLEEAEATAALTAAETKETPAKQRRRYARKAANASEAGPVPPQEPVGGPKASVDVEPPTAAETQYALLQVLESPLKKKERNETHERDRVYVRKDLKDRLDALSEHRSKGFKTMLINYGLEKALDELEQAEAAAQSSEE
ncbi:MULTISPECIES: hypothetical protein [unclassified Paenibacillus]|uniref:hypothetical protein n=1 Tax=unclassified Paenibacillus TaxID=185978 RepID=UPI001B796AEB|nr:MULTISPECIES: hypothetical protein [unclassified Paenibacillus]MBP1157591.1 putative DNA-binding protein [Paenibacillus sp. PvP091]MBP1171672.1 putative DNA-binding protein [Paenibacillus sp. PvR098]MBP2438053.1 putative DNA-binding protein [Paenibacillus sp. PvP052]